MNERCIYCRYFESEHEGAFGAVGEDICSCRICNESETDCPDYEERTMDEVKTCPACGAPYVGMSCPNCGSKEAPDE